MQHFIIAHKLQCGTQKDLFLNAALCQDAAVGAPWREPWGARKGDSGAELPIVKIL